MGWVVLTSGHSLWIFFYNFSFRGGHGGHGGHGPTIERILTLTRSGSTTAVHGSTGARRGAPQTENGVTARGTAYPGVVQTTQRQAATAAPLHLKPAAKSVATCTAAALSRSARSLS